MGSFSIWHWLVLVLLGLSFYGIYRYAKRRPSKVQSADGPVGVGGWLLLLVVGLMFLGPLMGAGRLNSDIMAAESQYPNLKTLETWSTFKSATWWSYPLVGCLSFYAGLGLAKGRNHSVVRQAKFLLWIVGPAASIVMGLFIPLLVFGRLESNPELIGGLIASVLLAAIWTAYLSKSKRVRVTYGNSPSPKTGI